MIVRPSGTEPKIKVYLEAVAPVAEAGLLLAAARRTAAERLAALRTAMESLTRIRRRLSPSPAGPLPAEGVRVGMTGSQDRLDSLREFGGFDVHEVDQLRSRRHLADAGLQQASLSGR